MNKKEFYKKYKERANEEIWRLEFETRFLERAKLASKEEIISLNNTIKDYTKAIRILKKKIELIDEILKGL
ncbi:MAG: hypothetical protein AB1414_01070 [bacterium]